ncbi:hypothetical protein D3C81_1091560 [compost metagenome]
MDHGIADFDPGGVTVEQYPADFLFQQYQHVPMGLKIRCFANQCRGQLPVQAVQRLPQLNLVRHFNDKGGRPEHFFL